MVELVEWLRAQLNEDERIAKAARLESAGRWQHHGDQIGAHVSGDHEGYHVAYDEGYPTVEQATHIAEWDPARVLREIDAKRQLLRASNAYCPPACRVEHSFSGSCSLRPMGPAWESDGRRWVRNEKGNQVLAPPVVPEFVVRTLALPYADRPGYREAWCP